MSLVAQLVCRQQARAGGKGVQAGPAVDGAQGGRHVVLGHQGRAMQLEGMGHASAGGHDHAPAHAAGVGGLCGLGAALLPN